MVTESLQVIPYVKQIFIDLCLIPKQFKDKLGLIPKKTNLGQFLELRKWSDFVDLVENRKKLL